MDFGKLKNIDDVDFQLPTQDEATLTMLRAAKTNATQAITPKLYIGLPVWGEKAYIGHLYPPQSKPSDFLTQYARQFNCIELNSTYYSIPDEITVSRWVGKVPDEFQFCPKLPRVISHERLLHNCSDVVQLFRQRMLGFEKHLGRAWLQMPPQFGTSRLDDLHQFVTHFPADIPLAVELRHPDWFHDPVAYKEVFAMLESQGIGTVITDTPGHREVLHQRLTIPEAMVRFVGHNGHEQDFQRLRAWVERIGDWLDNGLQTLWFFVHGPDPIPSFELALFFMQLLQQRTGIAMDMPVNWAIQNKQQTLF